MPREQSRYLVQRAGEEAGQWWDESDVDISDQRSAEQWLKEHGQPDETYRIIAIRKQVTLKVETRRIVNFA